MCLLDSTAARSPGRWAGPRDRILSPPQLALDPPPVRPRPPGLPLHLPACPSRLRLRPGRGGGGSWGTPAVLAVETFGDLAFGDIFLHLLTGSLALLADEFALEDFCSSLFDGFLLTASPR